MPRSDLTTHRGGARADGFLQEPLRVLVSRRVITFGVWLESESIFKELPRVGEVATNHWVFSKVWLITWLYLILLPILG